jgi:Ca2+-binding EF-hand superfamily protein
MEEIMASKKRGLNNFFKTAMTPREISQWSDDYQLSLMPNKQNLLKRHKVPEIQKLAIPWGD